MLGSPPAPGCPSSPAHGFPVEAKSLVSTVLDIDPGRQQVAIRIMGSRQPGEWESTLTAMMDSPDFSDGFGVLIDSTGAEPISAADLRRAVAFFRAHADHFRSCRWAAVPRDPTGYGMARMAQGLAGADLPDFQIFWTVDEALAWLKEGRARKLG